MLRRASTYRVAVSLVASTNLRMHASMLPSRVVQSVLMCIQELLSPFRVHRRVEMSI